MRMQSRLLRLALLVPAALLLGMGTGAGAQETHDHMAMAMPAKAPASAMHQSRWSDPASWPGGKVPGAGEAVTIGRDREIVLDVSPPALRSLTIDGKLSFADDRDLELKTDWVYLPGGELDIGSEARPHVHKATITLTDTVPGEDVNTMGDRGIMLLRGTLSLHGDRTNAWTKLAATARAGSDRIEVLDASGWRKGDVIVLASTDFDSTQAEKRTIAAVARNTITLDRPLNYMHFGRITDGVDERGEVGLLTRNIKIQASEDAAKSYLGGHIMAMAGSRMYVSGVELARMGQNMHLARYPIHWHILGDADGQYIENSSIHDTYSRCVTIHGTNNVLIKNNVTYNTVGHCFFMEDAVEHGNQFIHNLAMVTKCHPDGKPCVPTNLALANQSNKGQSAKDILIPSDNTASSYWITNPDNTYKDNVAALVDAIGDPAEVHVLQGMIEGDRGAAHGDDGPLFRLGGIEVGGGQGDHVPLAPAAGVQDLDPVGAGLGRRSELGPGVLAIAMQAQDAPQEHDPAVAHAVDVFTRDVVGQGDRGLVQIGMGLAADVQLAARQIDPVGLQLEIAGVREAELAVDGQAAQRRRTDVEDDVLVPADRHRVAFAWDLAIGPGRRIRPARPVGRRSRRLRRHGHGHVVVGFLSAGLSPHPEQQRDGNKQGETEQATLRAHDVTPRDPRVPYFFLDMVLQRTGGFAKPLDAAPGRPRSPGLASCRARPVRRPAGGALQVPGLVLPQLGVVQTVTSWM